jgi:hypothetical protein
MSKEIAERRRFTTKKLPVGQHHLLNFPQLPAEHRSDNEELPAEHRTIDQDTLAENGAFNQELSRENSSTDQEQLAANLSANQKLGFMSPVKIVKKKLVAGGGSEARTALSDEAADNSETVPQKPDAVKRCKYLSA